MGWCRERREIREKLGRHDRIRKQEKKRKGGVQNVFGRVSGKERRKCESAVIKC